MESLISERRHVLICPLCQSSNPTLNQKYSSNTSSGAINASPKGDYKISDNLLSKPEMVYYCRDCDFSFTNEDMTQITASYENMSDEDYLREEKGRRKQFRKILDRIRKFKKRGVLLDIGCGPGLLLDEAKKMGYKSVGVDLSDWSIKHANDNYDIHVYKGPLETLHLRSSSFDVITILDVIEHLDNPLSTLKEIERLLKPGGILYVSTPDIGSMTSRLLGRRWWGLQRFHCSYFTKQSLLKSLDGANFKFLKKYQYPRYFSLTYIGYRLKEYSKVLGKMIESMCRINVFKDATIRLFTFDQMDFLVRKRVTIENVNEDLKDLSFNSFIKASEEKNQSKNFAVLPAYNAASTLHKTVSDIPRDLIHEVVLVDDNSRDNTVEVAEALGLKVFRHEVNTGYGGNQKTCYKKALEMGADVVVMVHPDYQYDPTAIPEILEPILKGKADAVFGSRMMKGGALEGGMPKWKHNANILLTAFENVILSTYLTEYHSGFRAYSTKLLKSIHFEKNSDNFVFDTEIIVQIIANNFKIEEVPIRTRYFDEASSISLKRSVQYGLQILWVMFKYILHKKTIFKNKKFERKL